MRTLSNRRLLPVPLRFNAKHAEPAVLVMEGDALDHAGDFLSRRSALWNCGGHTWEFILPRRDGVWGDPAGRRFAGIRAPGQVRVRSNVSTIVAGLWGQVKNHLREAW